MVELKGKNLPLGIKITFLSMKTRFKLVPSSITGMSFLSQIISYRSVVLPDYKTPDEIRDDLKLLKWTEDPFGGKLDVIKHATFMKQAMIKNPGHSGDCDDFANYYIATLLKSGIVKSPSDVMFDFFYWYKDDSTKQNKISGHAVCVFKYKDNWWWAGNWNRCQPMKIGPALSDAKAEFEKYLGYKIHIHCSIFVDKVNDVGTVFYRGLKVR